MIADPLVSCLMPTRNRHVLLPAAVANFLAQDFTDAELLIVSEDGLPDGLRTALDSGRVRYVPCPAGLSLGAKRNFACHAARGELLAHWDDDDWYAGDRLRRQVHALQAAPGKALCGSSRVYFRELQGERAWEYRYQGSRRPWLCGATLLYRRDYWTRHPFRDQTIGEDNHFVWSARSDEALDLDDPALCIAGVHAGNSSRKDTSGAWWTPVPRARIDACIDASRDAHPAARYHGPAASHRERALLVLAGGIGDVLRWASLVPVLDAAGYAVDVLLAADAPDCGDLFLGAAGVQRVLPAVAPGKTWPTGEPPPALAVFAYWATPLAAQLPAGRQLFADRAAWPLRGDPGCVAAIARALGWPGALPPPPLSPALREIGESRVATGTLAMHAGCKAGWPWKKWHGFGELAQHFAQVLRVGTAADDDSAGTYFGTPIRWPGHVRDATAPRSLVATARLIGQCAAMVANDSGLMHLAAALGVPTLGIFGLTSPAREAMPWPALHPLSGGLSCEAACRAEPWGRRDCAQHLQCLRDLAAPIVAARLRDIAPALAMATGPARPATAPTLAPLPLAIRLGGGFGDLLLAGRIVELLWELAGHGEVAVYCERPELAHTALGGRGLLSVVRPLRAWSGAAGVRAEITQFVRFFDTAERWRYSHPALAALIERASARLLSVRGLVDRHPHLDGFWARMNLAAGRRRGDSLAWSAGIDLHGEDEESPRNTACALRAGHQAPLCLALDDADAGPCLRLAAGDRRWITIHDGFDTSAQVAPGQSVKCWPIEHWAELVRRLHATRPALCIVQIGGSRSRVIPGTDECLLGKIRFGEALWLLQGAALHIDGESGLVHAAYALGTPSVVLFGPTDRHFFGYDGNVNLDAEVCAPCWWSTPDWMGRCPRGLSPPACMAAISPAVVADQVLARLDDETLASSHSQVRPQRGAVWSPPTAREAALLAAIKTHGDLCDAADGHARSASTGCHLHASKHWEYAFALGALSDADTADGRRHIADLGCGRGALGPWLAAQGHHVVGYDRNYAWDGQADAAARFLNWAAGRGFAARPATLYALPAPDGTAERGFDAVLMISVLQHLAEPALALREALRILKPGGRLILTFDLACQPTALEDGHRRSIASPVRLAAWLGLPEACLGFTATGIAESASALQAASVGGMPPGLTVGGICLRKDCP